MKTSELEIGRAYKLFVTSAVGEEHYYYTGMYKSDSFLYAFEDIDRGGIYWFNALDIHEMKPMEGWNFQYCLSNIDDLKQRLFESIQKATELRGQMKDLTRNLKIEEEVQNTLRKQIADATALLEIKMANLAKKEN